MTRRKQSIEELLAEESDTIEADRDAPLGPDTRVTRGHSRTRTLQVRLNDEEYALLSRAAQQRHLPESTLARSLLLDALAGREPTAPGTPVQAGIDLVHARALVTELGSLLHVELRAS